VATIVGMAVETMVLSTAAMNMAIIAAAITHRRSRSLTAGWTGAAVSSGGGIPGDPSALNVPRR
jgi:hypothetical protein